MKNSILTLTAFILFLTFMVQDSVAKLAKNAKAPDFVLQEVNSGKKYRLSDFKDKIVVLEWHSTTCNFTKRHMQEKTMTNLARRYPEVLWLGIDSSNVDYAADAYSYYLWKQKHEIKYPILVDLDGKVGKTYGARVTPHMVIVNKGIVVYQGAIDDDVFADKPVQKRKNYVDIALAALTKNKKLPSHFKQYNEAIGCGIKY